MFTLSLWDSEEVYSKWRGKGEGEGRGVNFPWFGERGSTIYEFVDLKISHKLRILGLNNILISNIFILSSLQLFLRGGGACPPIATPSCLPVILLTNKFKLLLKYWKKTQTGWVDNKWYTNELKKTLRTHL